MVWLYSLTSVRAPEPVSSGQGAIRTKKERLDYPTTLGRLVAFGWVRVTHACADEILEGCVLGAPAANPHRLRLLRILCSIGHDIQAMP
jgi:hypothetical protein